MRTHDLGFEEQMTRPMSLDGVARLNGEALAGRLLAASVLRYVLAQSENPREVLAVIAEYVNDTLDHPGTPHGTPLDDMLRETARRRVDEELTAIASSMPR